MNKNGKKGMNGWAIFLVILVVAGVISYFAFIQDSSNDPFPKSITCDSTTTPSLNIKAYDAEKNTALTEATNLYRIKGEKIWNTFTAGTGFAVDPNTELEIVMGISTSDFTDNSYGQKFTYKVPCVETPSEEYEMSADEIETEVTATFLDENEDAGAQTFTTSQIKTVYARLNTGVDEFFGNPYLPSDKPNVMCLALNSTTWETPVKISIDGGEELAKVSTPKRHSATTGKIDYCYELPVLTEDTIKIAMKLEADGTTAPGVDDTATFYAGNWFFNSDNGEVEYGVEDQDGTAVGTDAGDTLTLDFTA